MTAPAASTPKWRVSDEELGQFETRARDYKLGARADVMLPAGFIGDLRDARALIAERDAEIARMKVVRRTAKVVKEWLGTVTVCDGQTTEFSEEAFQALYRRWRDEQETVDELQRGVRTARAVSIAEGLERAAKIADREFCALYDKARQILLGASGEIPSDYFKAMDKAESNRQTAVAIRAAIATASRGGDKR